MFFSQGQIQGRKLETAKLNEKGPGPFLAPETAYGGAQRRSSGNCFIFFTVGTFPLWCPSEAAGWDFRKKKGFVVSFGETLNFDKFGAGEILGARSTDAGGKA